MHISALTTRRPVATIMFFLAIILFGFISLERLSVDLLPDLSYPIIAVRTTYPNAAPIEVENFVTRRIEEAVSGLAEIQRIQSVSKEGLSIVTLEFAWGTQMNFATLNVREKLDQLRWSLPPEVSRPTIIEMDPSVEPIMILAVSGSDLIQTKQFAEDVIKRRLEQIQGIALASVTGGMEREIHVLLDPDAMETLGLQVEEIVQSLDRSNYSMPGGTIRRGNFRYALRTLGEFADLDDIGAVVVHRTEEGTIVKLDQVATIQDAFKERQGLNRLNGQEAVGLLLIKEAGENTVQVASEVNDVFEQMENEYPEIAIHKVYDQSTFISTAIANVTQAMILGGLLSFIVLFFFLHDVRSPLNIALSIPISIVTTFILFHLFNINLNIMSLGGLALGIGLLVDNSIVVLENIFRLRENKLDPLEAASRGAREVSMPLFASTFTTIAVFLPIAYIQGIAGQLFRNLAFAVTFSLLASLLVSLTLLPVLTLHLLKSKSDSSVPEPISKDQKPAAGQKDKKKRISSVFHTIIRLPVSMMKRFFILLLRLIYRLIRIFKKWLADLSKPLFLLFDRTFEKVLYGYENLLSKALARPGITLLLSLCLLIGCFFIGLTLRRELMPQITSDEITIELKMPVGSTLGIVADVADSLETFLENEPEVLSVFSQIGRARYGAQTGQEEESIENARVLARLNTRARSSVQEMIQRTQDHLVLPEGCEMNFSPSENLIGRLLNVGEADLEISFVGTNLDILNNLLDQVGNIVKNVEGIQDVWTSQTTGMPEIRIQIDREQASQYGFSAVIIAQAIQNQVQGQIATQLNAFDQKIDILVRPEYGSEDVLEQLMNTMVSNSRLSMPLRSLIEYTIDYGPAQISREDQVRQLLLSARIGDRSLDDIIQELEQNVSELSVPSGYEIEVGGVREEINRSFRNLFLALGLSIILVYMILAAQFESFLHPFIIILSVPFAITGTILMLFVTGTSLNIISLIGIVMLSGIAVNDAIIKISFINQQRRAGKGLLNAIHEAGRMRIRPILMTSVTTIFGMLPLALSLGPGALLGRPLAITVIGGLFSSTVLTLIVVPVIYYVIETKRLSS